jgi:hypothetical protein
MLLEAMQRFFGPHLLLIRDGKGVAYDSALKRYQEGHIGADVVTRHYLLHEHSFDYVAKRYEEAEKEREYDRWTRDVQTPEEFVYGVFFVRAPNGKQIPAYWLAARAYWIQYTTGVTEDKAIKEAFKGLTRNKDLGTQVRVKQVLAKAKRKMTHPHSRRTVLRLGGITIPPLEHQFEPDYVIGD